VTIIRASSAERRRLRSDGPLPGERLGVVGADGELIEIPMPLPRPMPPSSLVGWLFVRAMNSTLWDLIMRRAFEVYAWLCCLGFEYAEPRALRLGWISAPTDWRPYTGLSCAGGDLRANPPIGPPAGVAAWGASVIDP
jgi:hypothetical protein